MTQIGSTTDKIQIHISLIPKSLCHKTSVDPGFFVLYQNNSANTYNYIRLKQEPLKDHAISTKVMS